MKINQNPNHTFLITSNNISIVHQNMYDQFQSNFGMTKRTYYNMSRACHNVFRCSAGGYRALAEIQQNYESLGLTSKDLRTDILIKAGQSYKDESLQSRDRFNVSSLTIHTHTTEEQIDLALRGIMLELELFWAAESGEQGS